MKLRPYKKPYKTKGVSFLGHPVFSWKLTTACCLVVWMDCVVTVRVRIRFSVWLVSGCAHVFVLLSVVIVPYPVQTTQQLNC